MKILILIILLTACTTLKKQRVSRLVPLKPDLVISNFTELIARYGLENKDVGLVILDESGKIEHQLNADHLFIPASTNKLFTAAAITSSFKGHEQFSTSLRYEGILRQKEGLLDGSLYLVGGGDSAFNSHAMMGLLLTLKKLGIKRILGGFYFDDSSMPRFERIENTQDHSFSYNSGISALSFDFNQMTLFWEQDNDVLKYYFRPELPSEQQTLLGEFLINDDGNIHYQDKTWVISTETINTGSHNLPFKDAGLMTALAMRKMAGTLGIELPLPTRKKPSTQSIFLTSNLSSSVLQQMKDMLLFSNNLMAETLLIKSAQQHNEVQNLSDAVNIIKRRLSNQSINTTGMHPVNGSGLAAQSRFSPMGLIELTKYLYKKTNGRILSSLPISGRDGTLRRRMKDPLTSYRVWAKTGTMNYASCLAGYFLHEGQIKQFAIMVNDIDKRKLLDSELEPIKKKELLAETGEWIRRVRKFQDDIFLHLVSNSKFN